MNRVSHDMKANARRVSRNEVARASRGSANCSVTRVIKENAYTAEAPRAADVGADKIALDRIARESS